VKAAGAPPHWVSYVGVPDQFSWHDLATTDSAGGLAFYGRLFDWEKTQEVDMGPEGLHTIFGLGG
jgi:predicted enzyme related to lactoylglutathione lyase